jgi:hypothetical protein
VLFFWGGGGVRNGTKANIGLLYQTRIMDDDQCGAIGEMFRRENQNTRRKPTAVTLCPPQIPHHLTLARNRDTEVGSERLCA